MSYAQRPIVIQSNGLGTAGFVVSLLGLFCTCGLLCPIGLFFSFIALTKRPRGMAFAGLVLGALGSWWLFAFGLALLGALMEPEVPTTDPPRETAEVPAEPASPREPEHAQIPEVTPFRGWSSADGQFSVDARFIWSNGTIVRLRKDDGSEIDVPLDKLSDNDRAWIIARKRR